MFRSIIRFLKDENGPTAVEYCVMVMLIFLAVITVVQLIGMALEDNLQHSSDKLDEAFNG